MTRKGDFVTIASSTDKNFKKYLTTNMPVDGYSISSIEWSDKVGATKVTIAKDGQTATLSFNEALLRQPAGLRDKILPRCQGWGSRSRHRTAAPGAKCDQANVAGCSWRAAKCDQADARANVTDSAAPARARRDPA